MVSSLNQHSLAGKIKEGEKTLERHFSNVDKKKKQLLMISVALIANGKKKENYKRR